MAIKIKRPTDPKSRDDQNFVDRIEPRKAFWNRYSQMVDEDSAIITFYGAGGIGKTALLKKLEKEIKHRDKVTKIKCKYVKYDLNISTDPREVLKSFKFQLAAYGCTFPLFDTANYYYALKTGQNITPLKAKSMLEKIPWVNEIRNKFTVADTYAVKAASLLTVLKNFFDMTEDMLQAIPVIRAITACFSFVDKLLVMYMEKTQTFDADHKELRHQLNSRFQDKNPIALYEYLPTLFAQDVADWLKATNNNLIVLLDNYELVISETSLVTTEQLKRDLWLRGDDGLIFRIPRTLWVIAGRNKIRWEGELADELEQHLIKTLPPEDSDHFLKRAGIHDENLRRELVSLTEGYPIFLDLCVDVYNAYKRRNENTAPTIDEFGQKRQDVVARIFRYLDADKDDFAKDMLEFLCVLNVWTDDMAIDIGGKFLKNFSRNTYKRVKKFSFIQEERVQNEDVDLTIYRFDRTIQHILFEDCDENFIAEVVSATEDYFQRLFEHFRPHEPLYFFRLRMRSEFIIRFAVDSEELWCQYSRNVKLRLGVLSEPAQFDGAAEIVNMFITAIEERGDVDSIPYAHFELELSRIKDAQKKFNEVYNLRVSVYEKFVRLLGEDNPDTLEAMRSLAMTLKEFGRHSEALTLQEKVLEGCRELFGEEDGYTLRAMDAVADTLYVLGRYDEALALQEKTFAVRKEIAEEGDLTNELLAMHNTLNALGRYDEASALQEKILAIHKEFLGEDSLDTLLEMHRLQNELDSLEQVDKWFDIGFDMDDIKVHMNDLAKALITFGRYEEALDWQEQILIANVEISGENAPETITAINNLANTLVALGRYDEALPLQEKVLAAASQGQVFWVLREFLGDAQPDVPTAMNNLANTLSLLGRHEEALTLREKVLEGCKELFGVNHPSTIEAVERLAETLKACGKRDV